jgi:hypothetical protein
VARAAILWGVERWRVELPGGVSPPFEVYVNGVPQREGEDYELGRGVLLFSRPLAKEGRLGPWRWFLGAWGIGTYRKNDVIDVRYERDGHMHVAHALDIKAPRSARSEEGPDPRDSPGGARSARGSG